MKSVFISVLIIISSFSSNNVSETSIHLEDYYKVEGTFSGNTNNDDKSFHLIIAKNKDTKLYEIIPITYKEKSLLRLKPIIFNKYPSIVSFHNNDNILTLIVSTKEASDNIINVIDLNLKTEERTSKPIIGNNYKSVIRNNDNNILIFANKSQIEVLRIKNASSIQTVVAKSTESSKTFLRDLSKSYIGAINKNEFVANGSIRIFRAYNEGEEIFITREDKEEAKTTISKISLNQGDTISTEVKNLLVRSNFNIKKSTSFFNKNKLYQLKLNKERADILIFDLSKKGTKGFSILDNSITKKSKDFKDLKSFLKQASKGVFEPTITVNNTLDDNVVIRVDYVKKDTYNYHYDWWWHHQWFMQQQMMWQQQQMNQIRNSIPSGFGPSIPFEDMYFEPLENHFFEIVLNDNNEVVLDANTETIYLKTNKKKHIDSLKENETLLHASSIFLNNDKIFRYFALDKESKEFKIYEKNIND